MSELADIHEKLNVLTRLAYNGPSGALCCFTGMAGESSRRVSRGHTGPPWMTFPRKK